MLLNIEEVSMKFPLCQATIDIRGGGSALSPTLQVTDASSINTPTAVIALRAPIRPAVGARIKLSGGHDV
jgi:hypothetical protein